MSDEAALGPLPRAGAVDQGEYRYFLARCRPATGLLWPIGGKRQGETVCFVTLNPSTADAMADDPTIRRCQRFAWDWGFDRLSVVNLFALRAPDPQELRVHPDPAGPERVRYCRAAFGKATNRWLRVWQVVRATWMWFHARRMSTPSLTER